MVIIRTYDDLKNHATAWNPSMVKVKDLKAASDHINFPHEDYPEFVDQTEKAIKEAIFMLQTDNQISTSNVLTLHTICMDGKYYLPLGKLRTIEVKIEGKIVFPQPYMIPSMLMDIMPVGLEYYKTEEEIFNWYKRFETIHPFEDGNGRVGGVILAAMTYLISGEYLVPKMEFNYTIDPMIKRVTNENDDLLSNSKYFDQSIPYEDRCLEYLSRKIEGIKLNKILTETDSMKTYKELIDKKDLKAIIELLKRLS